MSDQFSSLSENQITTVTLSDDTMKQREFLQQLQAVLESSDTLSALEEVVSSKQFLIPHGVEQIVRAKLGLAAPDEWIKKLTSWGAASVGALSLQEYGEWMKRGVHVDAPSAALSKLIPGQVPEQLQDKSLGFLPGSFAGPYDWHIDERGVNAVAAWRMFAGQEKFANALPWKDVRIAHIDTGYTEHKALGWSGGSSGTVFPNEGADLLDGLKDTDGPRDPFLPGFPGHGTRISATIAGYDPTAQGGPFYGVAPGVQIIPFRVTDSVVIDHVKEHVHDAVILAIEQQCYVVNISLGALFPSDYLSTALDIAYEKGLIVVCAAGQGWGEVIYPGRLNRCVTLGGVGPGLKPWRRAAKGKYVDLCGPADGIRHVRAEPWKPGGVTPAGMATESGHGTSHATACCSGAAALWLAWHGVDALHDKYAQTGLWQIPKAFKYLAMKSAKPGQWSGEDKGNYGAGVLDVAALLQMPLPSAGSMRKENPAAAAFDAGGL